jgi:hypothetical protein
MTASQTSYHGKIKPTEIKRYQFEIKGTIVGAEKGKCTSWIELKINDNGQGLHAFPVSK